MTYKFRILYDRKRDRYFIQRRIFVLWINAHYISPYFIHHYYYADSARRALYK